MSKTIRYPVAEYLDVLAVTSRNQVFPGTKPTIGLRLWPFVPAMDEIFSELGDYALKVVITGDGVVPPITALLKFSWTGDWETAALTLIQESPIPHATHRLASNRSAAVNKVVNEAIRIIRGDNRLYNFPLYALQRAGVGNLQTEEEFAEAREAIIQHNFPDPLVGLPSLYSPGNETQMARRN